MFTFVKYRYFLVNSQTPPQSLFVTLWLTPFPQKIDVISEQPVCAEMINILNRSFYSAVHALRGEDMKALSEKSVKITNR